MWAHMGIPSFRLVFGVLNRQIRNLMTQSPKPQTLGLFWGVQARSREAHRGVCGIFGFEGRGFWM